MDLSIGKSALLALQALLALLIVPARYAAAADAPALQVRARERLLVVAPHPDDETLAAGGLIQRVLASGGRADVVVLTAGDGYVEAVAQETGQPRPGPADYVAYGKRRIGELRSALRELGHGSAAPRLFVMGFPDGGLEPLLDAHWRRTNPVRSATTNAVRPPYAEAVDPTIAYDGAELRDELLRLIREFSPTLIVFPTPLDRHPDHRATALFTLLAVADAHLPPTVRLLSYLVHWPSWPAWQDPRGAQALALPADLPAATPARKLTLTLRADELEHKQAALRDYRSQQAVMPSLLGAFARRTEPFLKLPTSDALRAERRVARELELTKIRRRLDARPADAESATDYSAGRGRPSGRDTSRPSGRSAPARRHPARS